MIQKLARLCLPPRFCLTLCIIFSLSTKLAFGDKPNLSHLSTADQTLIASLNQHLNQQKTLQSRFIQLDQNGQYVEGDLYWRRPSQARFEYDPPSPLLLIASGIFLIEVDLELEQISHYPQSGSIADYLLAQDPLLNPDIKITKVMQNEGIIRLTMHEREQPENGAITLIFNQRTMNLKRWEIKSPDGNKILFSLIGARYNLDLDDDLFHFHRPKEWMNLSEK